MSENLSHHFSACNGKTGSGISIDIMADADIKNEVRV